LACANKCVFCWRHHKNPVGTEWKWKMDEPDAIVEESVSRHIAMIKELRGLPGLVPERFLEAQTVRHCALSLVGEPIMYPRINDLIKCLHERKISTFLVTNAQFPDAMEKLVPVTQLYVSVDAANPEALGVVDRPLFKDYWDRFIKCLHLIKDKKQRTVYRLTLVKKFNMQDAIEYGRLVELGRPDFIEVKAVTYCGTTGTSDITMKDIPWHDEVVSFCRGILDSTETLRGDYEIACEHRHSCIVLLANKRFKFNDVWHTWIDYDKFHSLVEAGQDFSALDYCEPTPAWAIYGADERGFDPRDKRVFVKGAKAKNAASAGGKESSELSRSLVVATV